MIFERAEEAAAHIRGQTTLAPVVGIVLGSIVIGLSIIIASAIGA